MKTGKIIESTFKTELFYAHFIFYEQFTGITYPYFYKKLRKSLTCF
jgi:hypothetical protein